MRLLTVLLVPLLLAGCGFSLQNAPVGRGVDGPSYRITAEFADATGLPIGGKVRIGPATVGRVESKTAKDFVAHVGIVMREDVELPRGTTAGLELSTALGDQFVALHPPRDHDGALLSDGGRIPLADTEQSPSIEDTMALLGNVLNNSGIEQARTIVTELNTMLDGRDDTARALLGRLDTVLGAIERRTGDFTRTLRSLNRLGGTVTDNRAVLRKALRTIRPAVDAVRRQYGDVERLMGSVTELSGEVNTALRTTRATMTRQVRQLVPVLRELAAVEGDLGATLRQFETFERVFSRAAPGDYLNLYGLANVPDSVTGVLTGLGDYLPGGGSSATGAGADAVERLLRKGAR